VTTIHGQPMTPTKTPARRAWRGGHPGAFMRGLLYHGLPQER
jgi:hypothetical protein